MSYPNPTLLFFTASLAVFLIFVSTNADDQPQYSLYEAQGNYPIFYLFDEDLIHPEYDHDPAPSLAISSLRIDCLFSDADNPAESACRANYPGPQALSNNLAGTLESQDFWLAVNPGNLLLTTLSVENLLGQHRNALIATRGADLDIYFLEQQFVHPGVTDID